MTFASKIEAHPTNTRDGAAELLRAAAALRALAEAATVGPWEGSERIVWSLNIDPNESDDTVVDDGDDGCAGFRNESDAAYVAAMHPGVGLALAGWLESQATDASEVMHYAHKIARLINGENA